MHVLQLLLLLLEVVVMFTIIFCCIAFLDLFFYLSGVSMHSLQFRASAL